ncbi:MAG: response regulator [Myxococcota bacterium]
MSQDIHHTALVIEDDDATRNMVTQVLVREGLSVSGASTGLAGRNALQTDEFDVVVCDLALPEVDGFELLTEFRALAPETPIVIASAHLSEARMLSCFRGGAFDVLIKPYGPAALRGVVARALEHRRNSVSRLLHTIEETVLHLKDPAHTPDRIVEATVRLMDADVASLMTPEDDGTLRILSARGLSDDVVIGTAIAPGTSIASAVARLGRPALLQAGAELEAAFAGLPRQRATRSSIVFPLHAGGRVVGVLNVGRRTNTVPFRQADLKRLALLATSAALALENMRLMKRLTSNERLVAIGQVAGGVAHEINNPCTYVLSSLEHAQETLEQMRREPPSSAGALQTTLSDVGEALRDAMEGTRRIREIARDIRAVGRTHDKLDAPIDVNDAVRAAVRMTAAELRHLDVRVALELGGGLQVLGSVGKLTQVLINLLVNAAHATTSLPAERRNLTVRTEHHGDRAVVEVMDQGCGIATALQRRIFEPFFSTKREGGMGMGLWLSREIVRAHGGVLLLSSVEGEGSTFAVHLPLVPAAVMPDRVVVPVTMPRVLVVDDEAAIRRAFARMFARTHHVITADDGDDAIRRLQADAFDVVVTDLMMPRTSGKELFEWINVNAAHMAPRVVFMTGSIAARDMQAFFERVMNPVIEKPFEKKTMSDALEDVIIRLGRVQPSAPSRPAPELV